MPKWVEITKTNKIPEPIVRARWCESFLCRLRGLTFRRSLAEGEGLLLVDRSEGRVSASIHMWMVFFPIGVIWLNAEREVVDIIVARPWRVYLPAAAALYILEGEPGMIEGVKPGDKLEWHDAE